MESSSTLPASASPGLDASISSLNSIDNETSGTTSANVETQPSQWTSTNTSVTPSPEASRDSSPTRPAAMSGRVSRSSTSTPGARSRKNSAQGPSPPRTRPNNQQSAHPTSARQHLSSATTPVLHPPSGSEPVIKAPIPRKPSVAAELSKDTPRWPVSPRLRSPPPLINKPALPHAQSSRKLEQEPPAISIQRPTPSPHPHGQERPPHHSLDGEEDEAHLHSGTRTPARGSGGGSSILETVEEVSQPNTPKPDLDAAIEKLSQAAVAREEASKTEKTANKSPDLGQNEKHHESGSDSGSMKASARRSSVTVPPPLLHSRTSSTALKFTGKTTGETSSKNIMVEEEEVNSIPQVALGLNPAGQGANGSLKTKPSQETIRPRKEKKKAPRKQMSMSSGTGEPPNSFTANPPTKLRHCRSIRSISEESCCSSRRSHDQGPYVEEASSPRRPSRLSKRTPSITVHVTNLLTGGSRKASSKADIFEAKVASAVEEANSSDSDETFVYDSNPPDAADRPRRYHSRTPSATSMASVIDRNGMRSIHSVMEGGANVPAKKSMKFVNSFNSNGTDMLSGDDDNRGTGRGLGYHHHHAGRWGRSNGNSHLSILDDSAPFRSKLSGTTSRQSSNPSSPHFFPGRSINGNSKRQFLISGNYDGDDTTTGADDERTPLIHSPNRSVRSGRGRRMRERDLEGRTFHQRPSFLNRFASCLVVTFMLLLVITGAIGFMFLTSQPLTDVELVKISNVLASEQELMVDITVRAHNPNIIVTTIDAADLEVFAKSPHAGTDSEWWRNPHGDDMGILKDDSDDKPGSSPPNDTDPNMRLGTILEFDSPLSFESSLFHSGISKSTGELRLARPGNMTEHGSERWEKILADEFTLILRGVLKYTLPLSQRVWSVSVSGKTLVKPNAADNPTLRPNSTTPMRPKIQIE